MSTLTYRPSVLVEELAVGECTMHPVSCERGRLLAPLVSCASRHRRSARCLLRPDEPRRQVSA